MGGRLKMLKFIVCEDDAEELNIAVQYLDELKEEAKLFV